MIGALDGFLLGPFESFGFMRLALVACGALALANAPIGVLLLLRRMSLDADVLSHAVIPGAALGFLYAGYSLAALSLGGFLTGLVVAALGGVVARFLAKRQDGSLAAFYLYALALGVMIISVRGSNLDLMHVLFGTVLAIDAKALLLIAVISSATMLTLAAIYRPLAVEAIDPSFLRTIAGGGPLFRALFIVLVILVLVASFQAFGTLFAIGPILLPAATARCWTARVGPMVALAAAIGMLADYAGLLISYWGNQPSGPAIVLAGGTLYGLSLIVAGLREPHRG
jgi:zinc/manganese transport system permease protein